MPEAKTVVPTAISRRTLFGASAIAPIHRFAPILGDDAIAACANWIALDREIDRLTARWGKLETWLVRERGWFALTPGEQRALPEAAELFEMDDRLETLSQRRERLLRPLSRLPAETLHGVASKLLIAVRLLKHEENPAEPFVAGAVRELADMRCPSCGTAYLPAIG